MRNPRGAARRLAARIQTNHMKNDPYFKFVAAIILAGVIVAFSSASSPSAKLAATPSPAAHADLAE